MTSPFGDLAVIADPSAGDGRAEERLPAVSRALAAHELDHDLRVASERGEVETLTSSAVDTGFRYVVAVGDDATVQQVVNGLFRDGALIAGDPVLGVVDAGGGSDLLRSFGLPADVDGAVRHLLGDTTYPFDLMRITCAGPDGGLRTRYAHNLAQVGLGADVELARRRLPPRLGERRREFLAFWRGYIGSSRRVVRIGYDTKTWEGETFHVVVGNGQFASGVRLSPRSYPGDGVLDALVFTGQKSDAYTMMPRIMRHGGHVPDDAIKELRARIRFSIEADRPLAVVADGEPFGITPATFQIVPQHIHLKL